MNLRKIAGALTVAGLIGVCCSSVIASVGIPPGGRQPRPALRRIPNPAARSAKLVVNDSAVGGVVGDQLLSLNEAIQLANGTLSESILSSAERRQIKGGAPGASSRDRILIAVGTLTSPPAEENLDRSAIVPIQGNDGDTIDGQGATIQGKNGVGLIVSSSNFTLRNVVIGGGFETGISVDPAGAALRNIKLSRIHVSPPALAGLIVGSSISGGRLRGLSITDSTFDGGPPDLSALFRPWGTYDGTIALVTLAAANVKGNTVNDTVLEDVLFARNEVVGGVEGFYVDGALSGLAGGSFQNAIARNIRVVGNYVHDQADAAVNLAGEEGFGTGANGGVENVVIKDNRILTAGWGVAIWGADAFRDSSFDGGFIRHVDIRRNEVTRVSDLSGRNGDRFCVVLEAGRGDFDSVATNASITDVRISDNRITGCANTGIAVHAGIPLLAGNTTTGNVISDVLIKRNTVQDSVTGIGLRAAYLAFSGGVAVGNVISGVDIVDNKLSGNQTDYQLIGGYARAGTATSNTLRDVTFIRNRTGGAATCVALADSGTASGNRLEDVACP
jgi:hypothetical protein